MRAMQLTYTRLHQAELSYNLQHRIVYEDFESFFSPIIQTYEFFVLFPSPSARTHQDIYPLQP